MRLPDRLPLLRRSLWSGVCALALLGSQAVGRAPVALPVVNDPSADYPVILGDPYKIGATVFTPADTMNYDAVGYASVGGPATGYSAAHHTLPLPSYVEVTSLASGRTILVRVERRGPMDGTHALELSPMAAAQLGLSGDGAIRVRRVNPLETDRALLRSGHAAPERMATPKTLLDVLIRRLEKDPAATRAGASLVRGNQPAGVMPVAPAKPVKAGAGKVAKAPKILPPTIQPPTAGADYSAPEPVADPVNPPSQPESRPAPTLATARLALSGHIYVQVGAFSDRARAQAVAQKLGASVTTVGKLWRVRLGPYAKEQQAGWALAKARNAGYSEARIQHGE
ncbi:sporulation protein SsgA [Novosphingobium umbonatum]|uniref:Sporulation protein SsgA n=1 Tax=Novosphingobium umbonatum TaxID=1908524 RepID=A0A3S2YAN4_9SPHN|nr:SPOR domain-containing protein [Novosphingobium umbonatum]RVU06258.1 sporulation protein SsgA [Novosphingobium umbonatum]